MTFELEPLRPEHFDEMVGQDSQRYFMELLQQKPEMKKEICKHSIGRAGRLDGDIIGICGITLRASYLGECWAYLSDKVQHNPIKAIKAIKNFIKQQKHIRRIYCTVDAYNYKAIRFAETLGFKAEGIAQAYGPDGHDHIIYTIINRNLDWETR